MIVCSLVQNGIVPTKMTIGKVLINADIYEDFIQDAAGTFPVGQPKRQLIDQADWISYDSKAEVIRIHDDIGLCD